MVTSDTHVRSPLAGLDWVDPDNPLPLRSITSPEEARAVGPSWTCETSRGLGPPGTLRPHVLRFRSLTFPQHSLGVRKG